MRLSWTALSGNVAGYALWRGTAPYFAANPAEAEMVGVCDEAGGVVACADATAAVGDPEVNHFYLVQTTGSGGGRSLPSNHVGKFDFALTQP